MSGWQSQLLECYARWTTRIYKHQCRTWKKKTKRPQWPGEDTERRELTFHVSNACTGFCVRSETRCSLLIIVLWGVKLDQDEGVVINCSLAKCWELYIGVTLGGGLHNFLQRQLVLLVRYNSYADYNQDFMPFFFPPSSHYEDRLFNTDKGIAYCIPKTQSRISIGLLFCHFVIL